MDVSDGAVESGESSVLTRFCPEVYEYWLSRVSLLSNTFTSF